MPTDRPIAPLTTLFFALIAALTFSTGCAEDAPSEPSDSAATYTTRGQITQLPLPNSPTTSLIIQHESIPDFLHNDGKTTGMAAMTMPFPPAEGLDLSGLAVGDAVEITFTVDFEDKLNPWLTTAVTKLPADTVLDFSAGHAEEPPHSH